MAAVAAIGLLFAATPAANANPLGDGWNAAAKFLRCKILTGGVGGTNVPLCAVKKPAAKPPAKKS